MRLRLRLRYDGPSAAQLVEVLSCDEVVYRGRAWLTIIRLDTQRFCLEKTPTLHCEAEPPESAFPMYPVALSRAAPQHPLLNT